MLTLGLDKIEEISWPCNLNPASNCLRLYASVHYTYLLINAQQILNFTGDKKQW